MAASLLALRLDGITTKRGGGVVHASVNAGDEKEILKWLLMVVVIMAMVVVI